MKKEEKKEWIIRYIKKNNLDDILDKKHIEKKPRFIKYYSDEIQAICSLVSVLLIGIVTLLLTIQSNKISQMQLEVSKYENKPVITFFVERNVSHGIDCIKINNSGASPLSYKVEVISYFDVIANENNMGLIPIRVYTWDGIHSYKEINDVQSMVEIEIYNESFENINQINDELPEIVQQYTDLYWDIIHTYIVKVECIDVFNESNEFCFMCNDSIERTISDEEWKSVYDEYNCTILDESTGSHYVSKESYFNLETTNTDTIFRYALKKMRERNLYVTDYIDEKNVIYGEYEPEGV